MILNLLFFSYLLIPQDVKLYYNGAIINYSATVSFHKGVNEIYFTGIVKESVERILEVKSEKGVSIVEYALLDSIPELNATQRRLKRKFDSLMQAKEVILKRIKVLEKEQNVLERVLDYRNDSISCNPAQLSALLDTIQTKAFSLEKKRLELKHKLEEIMEKVKLYQDSVYLFMGPVVRITAISPYSKPVKVSIDVFTSLLFYTPVYTLNAEPGKKRVILSTFAEIKNNTGLKFRNVSLTVVMQYYKYKPLPDIVPEAFYYEGAKNEYSSVKYRPKGVYVQPSSEVPMKHVEKTAYAIGEMFTLSGKYTIGNRASVAVFSDTLKAEFVRKTYPRKYPDVYLTATLMAHRYPVYLKDIRVLVDGVYQGNYSSTYKDMVYSGDTFTVNFGKDNMVIVRRKKIRDFSSSSWTGSDVRKFEYEIKLKNMRDEKVDLIVYDNLPLFHTGKYKIKNIKLLPPQYKIDEKTGVVMWQIGLAPKESRDIVIYYEVSVR